MAEAPPSRRRTARPGAPETAAAAGLEGFLGRLATGADPLSIITDILAAAAGVIGARGATLHDGRDGDEGRAPLASWGDVSDLKAARLAVPVRAGGIDLARIDLWGAKLRSPFTTASTGRPARERTPVPAARWRTLEAHAALVGLALERRRLSGEAETVREAERTRLSRELHDGPAQAIGAAGLELERVSLAHPGVPLGPVVERIAAAFADLRALSRALRPPALEAHGLPGALRKLASEIERRSGTRTTYAEHGRRRPLAREVEWHLYRIAEEATANVARHSCATRAAIELTYTDRGVRLYLEDDGRGFDPGAAREGGMGLFTMRERARALGAALVLKSRPRGGTRIEVTVSGGST